MSKLSGWKTACAVCALAMAAAIASPAQTYKVLYSFTGGTDGANPYGGLSHDASGNFYGTTYSGGAYGYGTVFKIDASGTETVLHSFAGAPDGANPTAGLVRDAAGNFYGTTDYGGDPSCYSGHGCGTVFKLDRTAKEIVLHAFALGTEGIQPYAGLILDAAGNLYGTTDQGGAHGYGVVFKVDKTGKEVVLLSFAGVTDGRNPYAGLVQDAAGNLYGTTLEGGPSDLGTVFKLDATGKETVLHSFTGGGFDGALPYAALLLDKEGNLYGTTLEGGYFFTGTVFEVDATGTETTLYSFFGPPGADGTFPFAGLVRDRKGDLYGTTTAGGDLNCGDGYGCGAVFKLATTGAERLLYTFTGGTDGGTPYAGLIMDPASNLYGTTYAGGAYGYGVVFELTP